MRCGKWSEAVGIQPNDANDTKSLSSLQEQDELTMLVHMSSTNLTINILLEEALNEPDIGTTSRFVGMPQRWGLLRSGLTVFHRQHPFEDAIKEGLNVGLDLSREEREFHQVEQGLVLLFHLKESPGATSKRDRVNKPIHDDYAPPSCDNDSVRPH